MTDCQRVSRGWFARAKLSQGSATRAELLRRHCEPAAGLWRRKGWIHPDDPRGWFQWYCRYYMGRRSEDDARQIKRWKAIAATRTDQGALRAGRLSLPRRQRQALLHWAYDSRKI